MKPRLISLFVLITLLAASGSPTPAVDPAYQQSFDKWKAEQVDDLKKNWLVLAGLFWLKPGDNPFGSDPAGAIIFPKGPAHAGVFTLQGEDVVGKFSPDAHAIIAGKPATTSTLLPDTSGKRTIVEMGSLRFYVIKRGARLGIRLKDLDSEAARNFHDLVFFPLDLNYRVTATWVPSDGKKTVDVPTVLGDVNPTPIAGTVVFKLNGQEFQLTDLGGDPSKGLFIVFNDPTAKTETYPGGRFLDTDPVVNGTVVLDFNRAYNPPCAVTPYATCPLAPKENRLTVAIPVGEKYDHTHGHH
ncbi:MAG TPA: DUF1684 domain-containing protein [Terriglobales bacterium]|jgi:uncharacterized protein (DUF1684 family)|nr:DUF1684 domain-containing protein [Terriglobales bacterium]